MSRPHQQPLAHTTTPIRDGDSFGYAQVHVLGTTAALMGWIGPMQAAMLHLGPDIVVFVNSVKLLRVRIEGAA